MPRHNLVFGVRSGVFIPGIITTHSHLQRIDVDGDKIPPRKFKMMQCLIEVINGIRVSTDLQFIAADGESGSVAIKEIDAANGHVIAMFLRHRIGGAESIQTLGVVSDFCTQLTVYIRFVGTFVKITELIVLRRNRDLYANSGQVRQAGIGCAIWTTFVDTP